MMKKNPRSALGTFVVLAAATTLTGCFDDLGMGSRFQSVPRAIPADVEFLDRDPSTQVAGAVTFSAASDGETAYDRWTFDGYQLRWAIDGVPYDGGIVGYSGYIGTLYREEGRTQYTYTLESTTIPNGVNGILVFTSNSLGRAEEGVHIGFENYYVDPDLPESIFHPANVRFNDLSNNVGIRGDVTFRSAGSEDQNPKTEFYSVRFADQAGCPISDLAEIGRVEKRPYAGLQYYTFRILEQVYAPERARRLVVIPGNSTGVTREVECDRYATSGLDYNHIYPSTTAPFYTAASSVFKLVGNSGRRIDNDSTETFGGELEIYPAKDERDVLGYWVYYGYKYPSGAMKGKYYRLEYRQFFRADGTKHTFPMNRFTLSNELIDVVVVTGEDWRTNAISEKYIHKIPLNDKNYVGDWYLIKTGVVSLNGIPLSEHRCISADDRNGDADKSGLRLVACDPYDPAQRFTTQNIYIDAWYDDFHLIRSEKTGGCFYRNHLDGNIVDWQLTYPCVDSWDTRMELTGNYYEKTAKRIAVSNNQGNRSCASYLTPPNVRAGWGNCLLITDIHWSFFRAGNPDKPALFNDR